MRSHTKLHLLLVICLCLSGCFHADGGRIIHKDYSYVVDARTSTEAVAVDMPDGTTVKAPPGARIHAQAKEGKVTQPDNADEPATAATRADGSVSYTTGSSESLGALGAQVLPLTIIGAVLMLIGVGATIYLWKTPGRWKWMTIGVAGVGGALIAAPAVLDIAAGPIAFIIILTLVAALALAVVWTARKAGWWRKRSEQTEAGVNDFRKNNPELWDIQRAHLMVNQDADVQRAIRKNTRKRRPSAEAETGYHPSPNAAALTKGKAETEPHPFDD